MGRSGEGYTYAHPLIPTSDYKDLAIFTSQLPFGTNPFFPSGRDLSGSSTGQLIHVALGSGYLQSRGSMDFAALSAGASIPTSGPLNPLVSGALTPKHDQGLSWSRRYKYSRPPCVIPNSQVSKNGLLRCHWCFSWIGSPVRQDLGGMRFNAHPGLNRPLTYPSRPMQTTKFLLSFVTLRGPQN